MSPECEDMGVIGRDHGEGVLLAGQLGSPFDGPVKLHRLGEGSLGITVMVTVVDSPPWKHRGEKTTLWNTVSAKGSGGFSRSLYPRRLAWSEAENNQSLQPISEYFFHKQVSTGTVRLIYISSKSGKIKTHNSENENIKIVWNYVTLTTIGHLYFLLNILSLYFPKRSLGLLNIRLDLYCYFKCCKTLLVLIFHKQVETFWVPLEDLDGFLHHLRERGVSGRVTFILILAVFGLKQTFNQNMILIRCLLEQ